MAPLGSYVKARDESATYRHAVIPADHFLYDPLRDPARQGWDKSRIGWLTTCDIVKIEKIDPIVNPGAEAHHLHVFFGNASVNRNSTTQSLIDAPNSQIKCSEPNDRSSYWTPAVHQDGVHVLPSLFQAYYKGGGVDTQPMPLGLRMIAGSMHSKSNQDRQIGWWYSGSDTTIGDSAMITRRSAANFLVLRVNFPQCWDGVNLDSPDHTSHMAYAKGERCPKEHPVRLPQLVTFTHYDTAGGAGLTLSSGRWYTFHQDFWNGWAPAQMQALNRRCNLADMNCRASGSPSLKPHQSRVTIAGN